MRPCGLCLSRKIMNLECFRRPTLITCIFKLSIVDVLFQISSTGLLLVSLCSYFALVRSANNYNDNASQILKADWSEDLDWNLFKILNSQNSRNVIYSPLSLRMILALLYEGSSGSTELDFEVLKFRNKTVVRNKFNNILKILMEGDRFYDINVQSRIFLDHNIPAQQKYAATAEESYNTTIDPTDFADGRTAAEKINTWISVATRGKITKLVGPEDLDRAVMLVANALYFKGFWDTQFQKSQSFYGGFYTSPTDVIRVQFMTNTGKYYFGESTEMSCKLLRIPYKNNKYSFVVMLPNANAGLDHLISHINVPVLTRNLKLMDPVNVEVILPKFKFDFQESYTKILRSLGLTHMFDYTASIPGISRGTKGLVVSNILQKAGIEINEEGSVAYAASEVQLENKFGDNEIVFNATHPFAFFIQEHQTGNILFMGKVENPLAVEETLLPNRFNEANRMDSPHYAPLPTKPPNPPPRTPPGTYDNTQKPTIASPNGTADR